MVSGKIPADLDQRIAHAIELAGYIASKPEPVEVEVHAGEIEVRLLNLEESPESGKGGGSLAVDLHGRNEGH